MSNIFFWKMIHEIWWRYYCQTLFKNIKTEHIFESAFYSFMQLVFIVCQVEDYQNIFKLSSGSLAFTSYNSFSKNKRRSGTSLTALFSVWFLKKIFLLLYYTTSPNSILGFPLLCEILRNMCNVTVC